MFEGGGGRGGKERRGYSDQIYSSLFPAPLPHKHEFVQEGHF